MLDAEWSRKDVVSQPVQVKSTTIGERQWGRSRRIHGASPTARMCTCALLVRTGLICSLLEGSDLCSGLPARGEHSPKKKNKDPKI